MPTVRNDSHERDAVIPASGPSAVGDAAAILRVWRRVNHATTAMTSRSASGTSTCHAGDATIAGNESPSGAPKSVSRSSSLGCPLSIGETATP